MCNEESQPSAGQARRIAAAFTDPKSLGLVFAAYLYVAGFIFGYYYYAAFGLSFAAADVPVYHMFIFSFNVFNRFSFVTVAAALLIIFAIVYSWLEQPPRWLDLLLVGTFVAFLPIVFHGAVSAAREQALAVRQFKISLPKIETLVLKAEAAAAYRSLDGWKKAVDEEALRLLAQNKEYYFLIYQESPLELPYLRTYSIRKDDILAFEHLVR